MTKLLNFNPQRDLGFDVDRDLQFDSERSLLFDSERNLDFDPNRDLGFGKRGIIFRGYVCSNCKALVNPMAIECNECGAVFEPARKKARMTPKKKAPERAFCVYCGYPASASDIYCRNCGLKVSRAPTQFPRARTERTPRRGGYETVKLSEQRGKKVLSDWSETGKDFQEFVEE